MTGLYFAYRITDEFGISAAIIYDPAEKDFQISLLIGCLMLAVGYTGEVNT